MRSRISFVKLAIAAFLGFVLLCSGQAGSAVAAQKGRKTLKKKKSKSSAALPGDVIVHIATGPIQKSLDGLEAFLLLATEGLGPQGPLLQPGMIKEQISKLIPLDLLDMDGRLRLLVCNPETLGGAAPVVGLLFPTGDLQSIIDLLATQGAKSEGLAEGGFSLKMPGMPPMVIRPLNNKTVAVSDTLEHLDHIIAIMGKWKPKKKKTSAFLSISFDVRKFRRKHGEALNAMIAQGLATMTEVMVQNPEMQEQTAFMPGLMQVYSGALQLYASGFKVLFEQIRAASVKVYASDKRIRLAYVLSTEPRSHLRSIAKAYVGTKDSRKLARYLPKELDAIFYVNMKEDANTAQQDMFKQILEGVRGTTNDEAMAKAYMELMTKNQIMTLIEDTCTGLSVGKELSGITLTSVKDPAAYKKALAKSLADFTENLLMKQYSEMGLDMKMIFKEKAGEIDGIPFDTLSFSFDMSKMMAQMPGAAGKAPDKKMGMDITMRMAWHKKVLVQTFGKDKASKVLLSSTMKALKSKTPIHTDTSRLPRLVRLQKGNEVFAGALRMGKVVGGYVRLVTGFVPFEIDMAEFEALLKDVPLSQTLVTARGGATKTSLSMKISIPPESIQDAAAVGKAFGQVIEAWQKKMIEERAAAQAEMDKAAEEEKAEKAKDAAPETPGEEDVF